MNRTTIWLDSKDMESIERIREKYGSESNSAAIRLALRILATQEISIDASITQDQTKSNS
ncbi:MAG: ribbon-helix-helix protein, CopG family [Sphaerochaeta sp.]|jgi:hypothetical protein|nr:ribbon-helix-helix protein, CopG family [Sphaerochaeta sp.]